MSIPKYVGNIPGSVAYNKKLPPVVRDTYVQVRGLGVGQKKFSIRMEVMQQATGKSQSTLYEHLRLLELCKALRWSITNSVAILQFTDDSISDSEISEVPFKDSESKRLTVNSLRDLKKANSENSELPETWSEKGRELARAYVGWVGYEPPKADPGEIEAIEWLAERFTVEQIKAVYDELKSSEFWARKPLGVKYLRKAVPEHYAALERKAKNPNATNRPNPTRQTRPETRPTGGVFSRVKRN